MYVYMYTHVCASVFVKFYATKMYVDTHAGV